MAVLVLAALGVGSAWWAVERTGRTPGELMDYVKRRLEGHPKLETVALPVLEGLRRSLGEPDELERALPLATPPLPPNPATPGVGSTAPNVIRVGAGRAITRIGVAAQMAVDGSVIEIDAGDYVADVAVWERDNLTIRGLGNRVRLIASGADAEGKGTWVVRGGRVLVEGVEFVGSKVEDGNGAGIRLERGHLVVRRCRFFNNQMGILTSNDGVSTLTVEDSEFSYPTRSAHFTHNLYVGTIASFRITGSYLHHGNNGHLLKSRAQRSRVEYNRLTDEEGGRSSYELEFPNGGVAEVVGNVIEQSERTSNSVIVSYGAEGYRWPVNELHIVHNTLVNDHPLGGTFVRVSPGAALVELRNNLFSGRGKIDTPPGAIESGNQRPEWPDFERPSRHDYRLTESARARWGALTSASPALVPDREYAHPASSRPLSGVPRWPGAMQSVPP